MKSLVLCGWIALCGTVAVAADLPRSTPESQGVSSAAILAFVEAADRELDALHSVMVVRHGQVIAEGWWAPYSAGSRHQLFSLSKSFTSTAVGIAIAEGRFRLDDPVLKFFPDEAPAEPSDHLKSMRVSDLLRMSTGHQTEPPRPMEQSWVRAFLAHPVEFKPGTHFLYNTSATYMLSAIVQQATGETLLDYLRPRLFEPLGIENPTWETSPQGISTGGYGLSVRTEDIAKFGQFYLQKGNWEGKQLVPADWVAEATSRQTSTGSNSNSDWDQGYGYQFWRCRFDCYRGDGAFGQYCIVLPEQDAVIAITSGVKDMQAVLNLVWKHLLPGMQSEKLPADAESAARLVRALNDLSLPPQAGVGSPAPSAASGRTYQFAANDQKLESISLTDQGDRGVTIVARLNGQEQRIACERDGWSNGEAAWIGISRQPVAASGAWTDENTFNAKLCFFETPSTATVTLRFDGDEVRVDSEWNVRFGPLKSPTLTGKRVER